MDSWRDKERRRTGDGEAAGGLRVLATMARRAASFTVFGPTFVAAPSGGSSWGTARGLVRDAD